MKTIQLDLLSTILAALVVLFMGRALIARSTLLARFSIPAPVVGGVVVAILLAVFDVAGQFRIAFDMSLRDSLLLMFFTSVGLSADARLLARGGPKLIVFFAVSAVFIAIQNAVGIAAALAMDLHPLVGLLGGSVTLTGGHGTGAAYGGRFGAYTTIHRGFAHTTMSSRDPGYQGFKSLEMVLHESSHAVVGVTEGAIGPEIEAAAAALGVRPPRQLWHAVLFYTSGELTRRALEARAVPYRTYAHDGGLYDGAFRGTLEAIETHWQAWLDGELSREEAIRRMVQGAGEP